MTLENAQSNLSIKSISKANIYYKFEILSENPIMELKDYFKHHQYHLEFLLVIQQNFFNSQENIKFFNQLLNNRQVNMKQKLNYMPSKKKRNILQERIMDSDSDSFEQEFFTHNNQQQSSIYENNQSKLSKQQLQNLINRLNQNNKTKLMIRQQARKIQEQNLIKQQNNRNSRILSQRRIEQKLMEDGVSKIKKKESEQSSILLQMQKQRQQEQMRKLKEKPDICKNIVIYQKPMKERYKNIVQEYQTHLKQLCKQNKPSFQPNINEYSKFIAEIKNQNNGDFVNRISKEIKENNQKRIKKQMQRIILRFFNPRLIPIVKIFLKKIHFLLRIFPFKEKQLLNQILLQLLIMEKKNY